MSPIEIKFTSFTSVRFSTLISIYQLLIIVIYNFWIFLTTELRLEQL